MVPRRVGLWLPRSRRAARILADRGHAQAGALPRLVCQSRYLELACSFLYWLKQHCGYPSDTSFISSFHQAYMPDTRLSAWLGRFWLLCMPALGKLSQRLYPCLMLVRYREIIRCLQRASGLHKEHASVLMWRESASLSVVAYGRAGVFFRRI